MKTPFTAALMTLALTTGLFSCNKKQEQETAFKPRLDPDTKCQITIAGNYKNFEALEAEFDRFTEFYPQVELSYSYLDNYKATIKSAMAGQAAPDVFMTFPWMLDLPDYKELLDCAENMDDEKNSVNKNSENLAMSNEFMRFLTRTEELNNLAKIKRLISTSTDYSFDEIYSSLSKSTPLYSNEIGLMDSAIAQMRKAVESLMLGNVTIDQAVERYGNFSD